MTSEEATAAMAKALCDALHDMPKIGTDKQADIGKYELDYATLGHVLETIKPILKTHGLAVMQMPAGDKVKTIIIHRETGQTMTSEGAPVPAHSDPKKWGAMATYARRYSLLMAFGLTPDPDYDGNALPVSDAPSVAELEERIKKGFDWLGLDDEHRDELREAHPNDPDGLLIRLQEMAREAKAGADAAAREAEESGYPNPPEQD